MRFKRPVDVDRAAAFARRAFGLMDRTLASQAWLMPGPDPSIADIASFPYTALAHEGDFSLADFRRVIRSGRSPLADADEPFPGVQQRSPQGTGRDDPLTLEELSGDRTQGPDGARY